MKTQISDSIDAADGKERLDAQIKKILSNKKILSWIVKYTVTEFADMALERIEAYIEGEPEVAKIPVYPGKTNMESITGLPTEDKVPNEGEVTYDIRFYMIVPGREPVKIIINLEAQNEYYPGYDLVTRAVFYCARMLSAQLGVEFTTNTNDPKKYDNIKKVYSIWICMDTPNYAGNTITEYHMTQDLHYGNFSGKARYDLLSVVMICLNDTQNEEENELIKMLTTLLSKDMEKEEKKQKLQEEYGIPMDDGFGMEVDEMCNYSGYVENKGIEKGIQQGIQQGQFLLADTIKRLHHGETAEQIIAEGVDENTVELAVMLRKEM